MEISLEKNSINVLEYRFQNLLNGLDTNKHKYTSDNQKQTTIRTIKSFVRERLSEKKLEPSSEIWKILLDIEKLNFENIRGVKKIYSKLYNLQGKFHSDYHSHYYKQIGRESKKTINFNLLR